jgi:hypothetical protein
LSKEKLYVVYSLTPGAKEWVEVTKEPVARGAAALAVANEWQKHNFARALSVQISKAA